MDVRKISCVLGLALGFFAAQAVAVPATDIIEVDLAPLIDRAVRSEVQFAIDIRHRVSSRSAGEWTANGSRAIWTYSAQIPTAITISFHASRLALPLSAVLTMTAGGARFRYDANDIRGQELWSRIGRGDSVTLELSVEKRDRSRALLEIASFQAGFRALVPGMKDHPHYQKLKAAMAPSSLVNCTENYQCHVSAGNEGPGQATLALVVGNTLACTGTLMNDVVGDGAPYVLTARHCENGQPGGGAPGAASQMVAYWDAVTPCGGSLSSIFSASSTVTYGATTRVEQQDVWLVRLARDPPANSFYSGWDAAGGAVIGGYTVHHANANTKQFVAWTGNALLRTILGAEIGVGYSGSFWEVVNALGSVDHGASGAGLFNANHQLVGSLSRGANECPATPPPAPSDATAAAYFNSLAAVWRATSDPTSTTGAATIASVLDAGNTGTLSVGGSAVPFSVSLTASSTSLQVGSTLSLNWYSAAQSCVASGGSGSDGWGGAVNPVGSATISQSSAGTTTYALVCTNATRSVRSEITVAWTPGPPTVSLRIETASPFYAGQPIVLAWTSNLTSCAASGGIPGDGWSAASLPASGSRQVVEQSEGYFTFVLTCTDGAQSTQTNLTVGVQKTHAGIGVLEGPITLRVGQTVTLTWAGSGPCRATGGAPGDGWAGPLTGDSGFVTLTENTAGIFTYGVTCGPAGALPASASTSHTFTSAAATAALTANFPQQTITLGVPSWFNPNLSWVANVKPCAISYTGPVSGTLFTGWDAIGSMVDVQQTVGLFTYTLTCGTGVDEAQSTATINWIQPAPEVTLSAASLTDAILGQGTYLKWSTNVLPCTGSGGTAGDGWNGPLIYSYYNNVVFINEPAPGRYDYILTCGVGPFGTASASIVFNNPGGTTLTLAASNAAPYAGESVSLSWNSQVGPCTAIGGSSGDGWAGSRANSGDLTVTAPAGTYAYDMVCGAGTQAVQAHTVITFIQAPDPFVSLTWNGGGGYPGQMGSFSWRGFSGETCIATGGGPGDGWAGPREATGGVYTFTETQTGTFTYTLTCTFRGRSASQSHTLKWFPLPAKVTLTASPAESLIGKPVQLTWDATDATACSSSGGAAGDGWAAASRPVSGSASVTESTQGAYYYSLTCINGTDIMPPPTHVDATVWFGQPPSVVVAVDHSRVTAGSSVQISWNSTNAASCSATGGNGSDGWTGALDAVGNRTVNQPRAGTFTYTIQCTGTGVTTSASATITVTAPTSSGGGGGGGGGAFGIKELLALLLLAAMARRRSLAIRRSAGTVGH